MMLYRKLIEYKDRINSKLRILHYRLKFKNLRIDSKSTIGKRVILFYGNEASLTLKNVNLCDGVKIFAKHKGVINIKDTYIGYDTIITAIENIFIDSHCLIAEMVVIRDQDHVYGEQGKLLRDQGLICEEIKIEKNVWLAAKSTILKGVIIGENSIIGAHSLVNKNIAPNSVGVGIPVKIIKRK